MQTILGSGGAIGTELARALPQYTNRIRLVSRNPVKVNPSDELFTADLLNKDQVDQAVEGSQVVYLVAGLPYSTKAWTRMWPEVMQNTIDACKKYKARLVFFDNIYLYDPNHLSPCTEASPINPSSEKGKIRAKIASVLLNEMENKTLKALIARSPDFYGPGIHNSALIEAVVEPLKKGKKANWFCSLDKLHSFIWTPDAARATAILGNDESAYGSTWHLPTTKNPPTGREIIEMTANALHVKPRVQLAGKLLVKILGLFNPIMKEFVEMLYQYDRDYDFNADKFMQKYEFTPISYEEGVKEMIAHIA